MSGSILRDERGFAEAIILLFLALLFISVFVGIITSTQAITVSDVDVQEGVACAVKAAAITVNARSQADGKPRIQTVKAHAAFRSELARNLGLDTNSLAPLGNSMYARAPRYWLIIYNGYDDYASDGAEGAKLYYFDGSSVTETNLPYSGFPVSFAVSGTGIVEGSGGDYTVELESPGAVALVEGDAKRILGGTDTINAMRWAAARIVCKGGSCRVI